MGSLTTLVGSNNAQFNFFQSQINDDNGNLLTTGTFGTRNQPFAPVESSAVVGPAATVIITFDVIVNSIPAPNPFTNFATVDYTYIPGEGVTPVPDSANTNLVSILVLQGSRGIEFIE